jgi:hypothetical protein
MKGHDIGDFRVAYQKLVAEFERKTAYAILTAP